jgi:hypothetical protein
MKLIYRPVGLILGILSGLLARRIFDWVWSKFDREDPPKATTQETTWAKVIAAAALEGLVFKSTRVVVDRYGAAGWNYLTGVWPGEKRPDPER